jgi:ABC-type nitrate/sulfonate/bicarbonate transport system substrate-binding protein
MAATAQGYQVAIDDPDAAADALLAGAPELDEELVRASARYLGPRYAPDGGWGVQEAAVWHDFTDFLRGAGIVEGDVDIDAAWTNDFLPGGDAAAAPAPSESG